MHIIISSAKRNKAHKRRPCQLLWKFWYLVPLCRLQLIRHYYIWYLNEFIFETVKLYNQFWKNYKIPMNIFDKFIVKPIYTYIYIICIRYTLTNFCVTKNFWEKWKYFESFTVCLTTIAGSRRLYRLYLPKLQNVYYIKTFYSITVKKRNLLWNYDIN